MSKLALLGGTPIRDRLFPAYTVLGVDERDAVSKVIDSQILSKYIGGHHPDFMGGDLVQGFEAAWAHTFQADYAIAVNSATSGLYAALGATGVGPGDEVIVSPYTMVASVTAAIIFNAVPVFADIDPQTYCLSVDSIRERITPRTKAIIVVHIFGQTADMDAIMEIARENDLLVIEDAAQCPFANYKGRQVGTLGHMGVFSLNYHKHIHTGEGGVITTNDPGLAEKVNLIRNHAEAVVGRRGVKDIVNMIGFNFRMGEIEAAIGTCQLKKGPALVERRRSNVAYLESKLRGIPGLNMPEEKKGNRHVYYLHALSFDVREMEVTRASFVEAVRAELPATELRESEGPLMGAGYVRPVYLEPMFQEQIAYGDKGCPFKCPHYGGQVNYEKGICPETERAHFQTLITHEMIRPPMSTLDLDDVAAAFLKVIDHLDELRDYETGRVED